ncbi:DUF6500 family protein [Amphritea atlantica]|uniref:DUF6500 family protein n=1 Tax=Amphritea atlantica TaxID=355243 RepID=UPI0035E41C8F
MRTVQYRRADLRKELREKIIEVCDLKIEKKGPEVGLSFYAFFKNKNDNPEILMEAARWWIETHQLDHFEKAVKIRGMVESGV